jgi:hypothetical protein
MLADISSEHGQFERGEQAAWPEALRRGIAGDADAAEDVAALLDDVSPTIRTKAAEVLFDLRAPAVTPAIRRALAGAGEGGSEDEAQRRWCALALLRLGESPTPLAEALLRDAAPEWRRVAALAFAEQGDGRGAADLAAWWGERKGLDYVRSIEIIAALGKIRARGAVTVLARSLEDVRFRSFIADALGELGDPSARAALANVLASEAQVTARVHEAQALARLGGASWTGAARPTVDVTLPVPPDARSKQLRLIVLATHDAVCSVSAQETPLRGANDAVSAPAFDLGEVGRGAASINVFATDEAGIEALFLLEAPVPRELADAGALGGL